MILKDLGIPYEILEANERIGGRIFTHRFNGQKGKDAPVNDPARYDYYDVGAMRYPNIPFMDRVFNLFDRIGIQNLLIPYMLSSDNNLHYYNTQSPTIKTDATGDDYHVSVSQGGTVPDDYAKQTADCWTSKIYDYFKNEIAKADEITDPVERAKAFQNAWNDLTRQDHFSTRGYMLAGDAGKPSGVPPPYSEAVVEWLETFDSATGLYDEAFVESIIDSLDFDWPNVKRIAKPLPNSLKERARQDLPDWVCIDGGSDRMIDAMLAQIGQQPKTNKLVTRIYESNGGMAVECGYTNETFNYSQVICTAPLGCIGAMDLDGCGLLYNQKLAIRSLQYDASTKVGIKFPNRWWEDPQFMDGRPIVGGVSDTDIPIRVCVYPSYGLNCPPDQRPGILLASYTWAQDARRLGALVQGHDSKAEKLLVDLVIDNVAKLHNIPRDKIPAPLDHFAHAWFNDEYSRGAFALFGPGQFGSNDSIPNGSMFMSLKAPTPNGMLHFAGEATSIHHAWVLGGLNSAWRAVYNALNGYDDLQKKLIANWGIPDEETEITLKCLTLLSRYRALR
ncbi:hypothetical protein FRC02_006466 [Tulasnella sp. 418]|nr:hypothetical protein FRC02_006466 [Tulasnella sp. 418]